MWPGLTKAAVRRSFPEAVETWKGHGRKIKMNLRSTKKLVEEEVKTNDSVGSLQEVEGCYHAFYNLSNDFDQKMYTDQTGRFPTQSYRGMQYIMVLYKISSNAILVEPLRNRTSREMVAEYTNLVYRLKESRINPTLHILDNEISQKIQGCNRYR